MAKSIDHEFYNSQIWRQCAHAYLRRVGGLCERCKAQGLFVPAEIVHHKRHLNRRTRNDPKETYNFDNLEALCRSCHNAEHFTKRHKGQRWKVDELGRVGVD